MFGLGSGPEPHRTAPTIPPSMTASTTPEADDTLSDTPDVSASSTSLLSNMSPPLVISTTPTPTPPPGLAPTGQVNNITPQPSAVSTVGQRSRHRYNPIAGYTRAGVSIPKTSFQVPIEAPSTSSIVPPAAKGSKSEKMMVAAPGLLTPRNLFACDYLKDHTLSKSEFKIVWDNIDSETKKKYEALSEQRKLAALIASTAAPME